ncbi:MAG: efflux RND transporter periplasmic adaptor subunit [Reyranella sp.]|nr:efflux RND transporter periplasmic adaptor subunit [Reyranella sp.]
MRRQAAILLGIALLALLGACRQDRQAEVAPPVRPVLSVKAEINETETLGPFVGSIQPRYSTDVGFRVFGRMVARFVDVGAIVRKGDDIATLDPSVQLIMVRNAEAVLANAEAQYANAEAEEKRQRPLVERNITPQAQFDVIVQNRDTAAANLIRAKASLRRAQDVLSFTQIHADFDGVVTGRYAEPGQVVNPGQKIVTIARPEIREAVFSVTSDLADILTNRNDFEMQVRLDPATAMKAAAVRGVDPAADPTTRTRTVYLTLNDPAPAFRLGVTVYVTLQKPISPRIDLPATALLERDAKTRVWVVEKKSSGADATVSLRDVTVTSRTAETITIASGLSAGERVVTAGIHSLKPGQAVKLPSEARK